MKEEVKRWIEQAEEDYDNAKFNFNGKKYRVAAFLCQQSAEKSLKALLLKQKGEIRKIHDLVELGKNAGIEESLLGDLKQLTLAYIYSRYPDVEESFNLNGKLPYFLNVSKEVLKWVKQKL